ncbi:hypothetical protein F2Q69_00057591 [Brassica cretica]|uniref:DNA topoisomerase (ATP-hydrolyzing) n=1 Tax=Brassica cretica TaxID=69181 RepID=A0A8S9N4D7_BRACR|nr:hypothetical protein F2Q69_00057591 [Brassica cretica]
MADLQRSIPSMVDGLKPGQRKIPFCSFKWNFIKATKVAQFSGYVTEHSAYHHSGLVLIMRKKVRSRVLRLWPLKLLQRGLKKQRGKHMRYVPSDSESESANDEDDE